MSLLVLWTASIDAQISDRDTELKLGRLALSAAFEECPPIADAELQRSLNAFGREVLDRWPTPLKGYNYEFHVTSCRDLNASAAPGGEILVSNGLLETLDEPEQLAALLAHEIAHVEYRHGYRKWRNWRNRSMVLGIVSALGNSDEPGSDNSLAELLRFILEGNHFSNSRDREREADLVASLYLHRNGIGDQPLRRLFEKLRAGGGGSSVPTTHPHIGERIARARTTEVLPFQDTDLFHGLDKHGSLVATLRFDLQRQYRGELDVIATLSATEQLGKRDNVNTLHVHSGGRKLKLKEWSAEQIEPQGSTTPIFRTENQRGFIGDRIERVDLKLRNVDRWVPAYTDNGDLAESQFEGLVFSGYSASNDHVAEVRFLQQRLVPGELHVTVRIGSTAALCEKKNCGSVKVGDIEAVVAGLRLKLSPMKAAHIRPGGAATVRYRVKGADAFLPGVLDSLKLKLRNVERWEPGRYKPASVGGAQVEGWVRRPQ